MAQTQGTVDVAAAAVNPSKFFETPQDVLTQAQLSREDKIKILHQWETDARLLQVAEEENMGEGERSQLGAIVSALIALGDESKNPHRATPGSPAKQGG